MKKQIFRIIIVSILTMSLITVNVLAYIELSYGYHTNQVDVQNNLWSSYSDIFDLSASAWNASIINGFVYESSSSDNYVANNSVMDTWFGNVSVKKDMKLFGDKNEMKYETFLGEITNEKNN